MASDGDEHATNGLKIPTINGHSVDPATAAVKIDLKVGVKGISSPSAEVDILGPVKGKCSEKAGTKV